MALILSGNGTANHRKCLTHRGGTDFCSATLLDGVSLAKTAPPLHDASLNIRENERPQRLGLPSRLFLYI
jgi:hypothetical protein